MRRQDHTDAPPTGSGTASAGAVTPRAERHVPTEAYALSPAARLLASEQPRRSPMAVAEGERLDEMRWEISFVVTRNSAADRRLRPLSVNSRSCKQLLLLPLVANTVAAILHV